MKLPLENGVLQLHKGQQPGRVVNNFYWPGWICSYEVTEWSQSSAL